MRLFSMRCAPSNNRITRLCNPFINNDWVNTFRVSDRAMKAVTSSTMETVFSVEPAQSA
jgi:hypothetical protein